MRLLRIAAACALIVALAVSAEAGQGQGKKSGKKGNHPAFGVVTAVNKSKDNTGSITVKVFHRHKKAKAAAKATAKADAQTTAKADSKTAPKKVGQSGHKAKVKTFTVTASTKFEKVSGKKGQWTSTSAAFENVKQGDRVLIIRDGKTATTVKLLPAHQKGSKKAAAKTAKTKA